MSYGKKYQKKFQNISTDPTNYRVELHKKDYSGASTNLFILSPNPVTIRALSSERDKLSIVRGSELIFEFKVPKENIGDYSDLFEAEYKDWLLKFYNDDTEDLIWTGWVMPENMYREVTVPNITIQLVATDALKFLQYENFVDSSGWVYGDQLMSGLEIIKEALIKTGIELDFLIKLNTYETIRNQPAELCLATSFFNTYRFTGEGSGRHSEGYEEIDTCLDVLEKVLKLFNVTLMQRGGKYKITSLHEQSSFNYLVNWSDLATVSRTATDDEVEINHKFLPEPELTMMAPIDRVDIIHRNRNIGDTPLLDDSTDWNASWDITYQNYSIVWNRLTVNLDQDFDGDGKHITLKNDFNVSVDTEYQHYIKVRLEHAWDDVSEVVPYFKIGIKKGGSWFYTGRNSFSLAGETYESPNTDLFRVYSTGDYSVRIVLDYTFLQKDYVGPWNMDVVFQHCRITETIINEEGEEIDDLSFDKTWRIEAGEGKIKKSHEVWFGDTGQFGDLGAIYVGADSDNVVNSLSWNRYNKTDEHPIIRLYGQLLLNDRQRYKEYFHAQIKDPEIKIKRDSVIKYIRGGVTRYYLVHSYDRDYRSNNVTVDLMEVFYDDVTLDYSPIPLDMSSIDGVSTGGSTTTSTSGGVTSEERSNWNIAYDQRRQWDGGNTGLTPATGRTSLGLGTTDTVQFGKMAVNRSTVGAGLRVDIDGDIRASNLGTLSALDKWTGTQAEYDALGAYSNDTLYLIEE